MLTKQERAAIAERASKAKYSMDSIFEILNGYTSPEYMTLKDDFIAMVNRILDLCDTSDMVELPRDKDGEVIHVGDIVYEREGAEWQVRAINLFEKGSNVSVRSGNVCSVYRSDVLTHKKPVENAVLAEQIRAVIRSAISMPNFAVNKLSNIAEQLESLGDSDD